ncbi:Oidioi.mRNA.OKI2018_I69.PAR.g9731.t1.cds [Oikopleura dioica]|uniref:Oidioi.mRNA.OKI2018_I69.PAR.g9731.t1.cds n=1 Tax=Oikopleura dioica TaxID=34765 RepID=A0ABN7RM19_OIKDI|nr:Oidioi.mRNA.OKI2018_I69.PAR.g9731.t1.cds [Oikopleura dioica]
MESRGQVPAFLSIEDPLTEWNDIGRSSYKALEMKEKFHYAFMVLSRAVAPQASYHNTGSILAKILNFDDDVIEYRRWVNKHWENKVPRIKIVEPTPPPPAQKSRNSSVGKQSFFPDEQSSIGVISDGESSILSEEELSPIRKDRKVEYRRSSDQVTNKERRSNSDSSAKANYEENFPDISESKNAPSEKASSANYLSDKNNNDDMPRPRDDHDNRTRSKKEPKSEAESESDRKQRRERMNRMSAGSGILGMPRIMRSAFANLGEPDRVNARNVNINDASSTGSRGTDSFPSSSGSKSKRPTKEFYKPRGVGKPTTGEFRQRESYIQPKKWRFRDEERQKKIRPRFAKKKDGQSENRR